MAGLLTFWCDIVPVTHADERAPLTIYPPVPTEFEMRVIVYRTRDVPPHDGDPDTKNDMFFRLWLSTQSAKDSDTHFRCGTGVGEFNWRFKARVLLSRVLGGARLSISSSSPIVPLGAV